MEFRILGALEVVSDGGVVALAGSRPRTIVALLLLHANAPVSAERLAQALWGEDAPADAAGTVQVYVSRLRKALGERDVIETSPAGYTLRVPAGALDAERFGELVEAAEAALAAGHGARAGELVRSALALWRGPALADFAFAPFARAEIARLEEQRMTALELRIDADLATGRHTQVIGELQQLADAHPTRERLAGQLMTALYRSGRQAEALAAYRHLRTHLADELGLDPGPELRALELQILGQEPSLDAPRKEPAPAFGRVPAQPTSTIGRERDVQSLVELLERPDVRLVTVSGPAGVGKTRVALVAADRVAARFADGTCWVELAAVARPEDVPSTIARALGLTPVPGESPLDALPALPRHQGAAARDRQLRASAGGLSRGADLLAACPRLTVLTTSREALDLRAEHRYVAAPLAVPPRPHDATPAEIEETPATAMLLAAIRRYDTKFQVKPAGAASLARISVKLDGLPLALELAAAQTRYFGPERLADRLDHGHALGAGPRDAPDRQRTLHATIDWSHRLLPDEIKAAFASFSVFAGWASFEAAEAVTGADASALEALIDKHLLDRGQGVDGAPRLRMLDFVRAFAHDRLAETAALDEVHGRHAAHYLALLERITPALYAHGEADALRVLDADVDNLRAALTWAIDADPVLALRLAGCLRPYWRIRREGREGLAWIDAALRAAGPQAPSGARAAATLGRSDLRFLTGDPEGALQASREALDLYRQAGDDAGVAVALCSVAGDLLVAADLELAQATAEEAYALASSRGDEALMGRALGILAPASAAERRRALLDEAARLLRRSGNLRELGVLFSNCAYGALQEGRPAEALALQAEADATRAGVDDPLDAAIALANIGVASLLTGDFERARDAFARQLGLCAQQGIFWQAAESFAGMAALALRDGEVGRAARLTGAARAWAEPFDGGSVRLVHRAFIAGAERTDPELWRREEEAGAAMTFGQQIACATADDQRVEKVSRQSSRLSPSIVNRHS